MGKKNSEERYDALLLLSFGGPEGKEDVLPFLDNVLRGKNVPLERKQAVAEHYYRFGGVSPINQQNRNLIAALKPLVEQSGPRLPIYWGNRNWHPMLADTIRQMAQDGVKKALAFVTAAYGSYSSCRQYQENILEACRIVGPQAPQIDKIRPFFNHPGFVEANADNLSIAIAQISDAKRAKAGVVFTAHSIPQSMADHSPYAEQLLEVSRLVADAAGVPERWQFAYQSRSGPPSQPWLEPDILEYISRFKKSGGEDLVVCPIGFISDHMEVLYDLDKEAKSLSTTLGVNLIRTKTAGTHATFIKMVQELVEERLNPSLPRRALGSYGPSCDICPEDCCPIGTQPNARLLAVKPTIADMNPG
jgi:ferrochelatase